MAFTSLLAPSYLMLFPACIPVPPPGLKLCFFSLTQMYLVSTTGFPHVVHLGFCSLGEIVLVLIFVCPLFLYPVLQVTSFSDPTLRLSTFSLVREIGEMLLGRISAVVAAPLPQIAQRESFSLIFLVAIC